jgi:hypothetical protein
MSVRILVIPICVSEGASRLGVDERYQLSAVPLTPTFSEGIGLPMVIFFL